LQLVRHKKRETSEVLKEGRNEVLRRGGVSQEAKRMGPIGLCPLLPF